MGFLPKAAPRLPWDAAVLPQVAAILPQDAAILPQDAAFLNKDAALFSQKIVLQGFAPGGIKAAGQLTKAFAWRFMILWIGTTVE